MNSLIKLVFLLLLCASVTSSLKTAYNVLEEYDFPIGLLPAGVADYDFNSSSGHFKVYLPKTCSYNYGSYTLKYKTLITGRLIKDRLYGLGGIQVRAFWLWFGVSEVNRDGNDLNLSVGIGSATFPVRRFAETPHCGCGFDCELVTVDNSLGADDDQAL